MTVLEARTSPGARKWWALAGLSLGVLAVGLDATVLSVALPTLAVSLHASATDLQWFISSYTLALAVGLLPGGLLGDRFGRKKVMIIALSVFGLGSLACAYSPNAGVFIAARTVLGLSAGCMIPLVLSVVTVMFTDTERTKAVSTWAAANFLALPIGPILGGWLLSSYWWGWVFLMNLPVVAIGLVAVTVLVPESRAATRPSLDPVGIVTSCCGLAVLIYGFIAAGQYGWSSPTAIFAILAGLAVLAGFVAWELHLTRSDGSQPLVDLSLFRSARFTWGTILQAFGIFAMFGLLFAAPQFFQAVLGTTAMGSGLRLLPLMAGLALGAGLADQVARRITAKLTVAAGFTILAAGLVLGTTMTAASGTAFIAAWTAIAGMGFGLALATAASAALVDLPKENAGIGSAVMQAVQKAGAPLSAAVLGSVLASSYHSQLPLAGLPAATVGAVRSSVFAGIAVAHKIGSPALLASVRSAFVHGIAAMLWVSAGLAVAGVVLALLFLPWRATTADSAPGASMPVGEGEESAHERVA
ncbi:MAG TPA: DHA2 family efflux MFS transporter permease subunit [Streptosporangiaceae bacterium]